MQGTNSMYTENKTSSQTPLENSQLLSRLNDTRNATRRVCVIQRKINDITEHLVCRPEISDDSQSFGVMEEIPTPTTDLLNHLRNSAEELDMQLTNLFNQIDELEAILGYSV